MATTFTGLKLQGDLGKVDRQHTWCGRLLFRTAHIMYWTVNHYRNTYKYIYKNILFLWCISIYIDISYSFKDILSCLIPICRLQKPLMEQSRWKAKLMNSTIFASSLLEASSQCSKEVGSILNLTNAGPFHLDKLGALQMSNRHNSDSKQATRQFGASELSDISGFVELPDGKAQIITDCILAIAGMFNSNTMDYMILLTIDQQ